VVIELVIGDAFFQATPLFFSEYKRAVAILADIERDGLANNMPGVLASYDALLEILCAAICRSGAKVTAQGISGALTPAQIMETVGLLMQRSGMGNASAEGKAN
jgi:hypothetical protein